MPVEYDLRRYHRQRARIDAVGARGLSDTQLRSRFEAARREAASGTPLDDLLPEVFALTGEACARALGMRPFDVQMMAAVALHEGKLAQLATGEGKTLVAVHAGGAQRADGPGRPRADGQRLPGAPRRRLDGRGLPVPRSHRRRGRPSTSTAQAGRRPTPPTSRTSPRRRPASTSSAITPSSSPPHVVQRPFHYAIVDEADFILIDEARVPLVIAGETAAPADPPSRASPRRSRTLQPGRRLPRRRARAERRAHRRRVPPCAGGAAVRPAPCPGPAPDARGDPRRAPRRGAAHARPRLHRARRPRSNSSTSSPGAWPTTGAGRTASSPRSKPRRASTIRPEGVVLGSIPIQHFVRLWPRLAGMTATAVPAAAEFLEFYGLTTVVFPPNRPCRRVDEPDVVFTHRDAKMAALADEIARVQATGRPVLVGTASVAESEALFRALRDRRVKCRVLNARHDAREAVIVAAGRHAGRRHDFHQHGRPRHRHRARRRRPGRSASRLAALGGLYVIGTNRHESRRVDDQLRGRAGRQGDPGSSRFFISLEDDLISRYGVMALIPPSRPPRAPGRAGRPTPSSAREIARAQRIIEGQHFEIRRTLWRYSAMVEEQRAQICARREELLQDESEPTACAEAAPEHHAALVRAVGAGDVARVENRLTHARPRPALERPPAAHRGHPGGHPPAAVRRARPAHGVPAADHRRLRRR